MQDSARHHGQLAAALATEGRWTEALNHAKTCLELAPAGGSLHTWALHMLVWIYIDTGRPRLAAIYAKAYLRVANGFPELAHYTPWVVRALAHADYQERRFMAAAAGFSRVVALFEAVGNHEQAAVTRTNLIWSLVRAGRIQAARQHLPHVTGLPTHLTYLLDGAAAAVLAAEGRWQEAAEAGKRALSGTRLSHDFADAAEVSLIIADSLRKQGETSVISLYIRRAAEFIARQEWSAQALLALNQRENGGENLHVFAAVARGSADLLDRGCFSTGVA